MTFAHPDPDNPAAVLLAVKAVPGPKRDAIAGVLHMPGGDRLKVRTSAPPEGGRANKAICALVARSLGVRASSVTLVSGQASAEKVLRASGVSLESVLVLGG